MFKEMKVPDYWKSTLEDIDETVKGIKKGKVRSIKSAGKRPVYLIEYGKKNEFNRTANLSSAAGSRDFSRYADKKNPDVRPTLLLVGAQHGAEFEGTVALLNLINIIENGVDFSGKEYPQFKGIEEEINLLIIPCHNCRETEILTIE